MKNDEVLSNFVAITGLQGDVASSFLESVGWDLTEAVNLFLASGMPAAAAPASQAQGSSSSQGIDVDDDPPEEVYTGASPEVHQLIDPNARNGRPRPSRAADPEIPGAFGDSTELGRLYKAPSYAFVGTFEEAKAAAAEKGKWLLVNLYGEDCFASQQMNRDTWSNSTVQAAVEAYFLLWQPYSRTESGQKFSSLYHVHAPVCVVVDPRTGEAVDNIRGFVQPIPFVDQLTGFLDNAMKHGMVLEAIPNIPDEAADEPTSTNDQAMHDALEDPELQSALAASLEPASGSSARRSRQPVDDDEMDEDLRAAIQASLEYSTPSPTSSPPPPPPEWKPRTDFLSHISEEGSAGKDTVRLLVQLADSSVRKTLVRTQAPLAAIFDFVRSVLPEAQTRPFKLLAGFPPKEIADSLEITVGQSRLANEKLTMGWC
eukprot:RCo038977